MSIRAERDKLMKRMKHDSRKDLKAYCKARRFPYQTVRCILNGKSPGTMRSWLRFEKSYEREDKK